MRKLDVYFNDVKAGILTEKYPGKDYSFQYLDEYVDSTMPPISITFPKQKKVYISVRGKSKRQTMWGQRIHRQEAF